MASSFGNINPPEDSIPEKPTFREFNPHTNNKHQ